MVINENINLCDDYVSYDIAKLLKEKGFDSYCEFQYINCSGGHPYLLDNAGCYYRNLEIGQDEYSAPTLQMTMKWLREKYNIYIEVNLTFSENPEKYHPRYYVYVLETKSGNSLIHKAATIEELNPLAHKNGFPKNFNTYEEACEIAIKYCLENLV